MSSHRVELTVLQLQPKPGIERETISFGQKSNGLFLILVDDHGLKRVIVDLQYDEFFAELASLTGWSEDNLHKDLDGTI